MSTWICPESGTTFDAGDTAPADAPVCPDCGCPMAPLPAGASHPPPWRLSVTGGRWGRSPGQDPIPPGRWGRYQVEGVIGRGPLAVVYRAYDEALGAGCALKVFRPEALGPGRLRPGDVLADARAAAAVECESAARMLAAGCEGDLLFIASELVDGLPVRAGPKGPMAEPSALRAMRSAATALAAGHELGICHGGIKPSNVLLKAGAAAVVTDFASPACRAPLYVPPEEEAGEEPSAAGDVYSLGAVFRAAAAAGEHLGPILARCTAEWPEDRYDGAAELLRDLDAAASQPGGRPARRLYCRAVATACGAVLLAVVVLLVGPARSCDHAVGPSSGQGPGGPPSPHAGLPPDGLKWTDGHAIRSADQAEMVFVAGGSFLMGGEGRGPDAVPVHEVRLGSFFIDRYEVSVGQYRRYLAATGGEEPESMQGAAADLPATGVNWYEARDYAAWAGARLPTEAQWELAARGRESLPWPWGSEWDPARCRWRGSDGAGDAPAPVNAYPTGRSPWGVENMIGNAAEWCADWYSASFYGVSPNSDPVGPPEGEYRVVRGGSYASDRPALHTAARWNARPDYRSRSIGFRCVVPQT
jgi:formylglycine-generating enzyme required for sulfatase activity